jgi:hypothetical protein
MLSTVEENTFRLWGSDDTGPTVAMATTFRVDDTEVYLSRSMRRQSHAPSPPTTSPPTTSPPTTSPPAGKAAPSQSKKSS